MCGIVGLLVRTPALRERLGELVAPMLVAMSERGPDSAGLAIFSDWVAPEERKLSLYCASHDFDWQALGRAAGESFEAARLERKANHALLITRSPPSSVTRWLRAEYPQVHRLSIGRSIDLYKDVGCPAEVAARYEVHSLKGSHAIAHTRMATESAVTIENAHPYTAGEDWCIVHNGSLSNPYSIRRKLERRGIEFEGDCDTEAASRYLEWRMREGEGLATALHRAFEEFDGFYTFLMATQRELAVVRDSFACKPAIVAECEQYVAVASEFRALAHLPEVEKTKLFEPKPGEVYSWAA